MKSFFFFFPFKSDLYQFLNLFFQSSLSGNIFSIPSKNQFSNNHLWWLIFWDSFAKQQIRCSNTHKILNIIFAVLRFLQYLWKATIGFSRVVPILVFSRQISRTQFKRTRQQSESQPATVDTINRQINHPRRHQSQTNQKEKLTLLHQIKVPNKAKKWGHHPIQQ